MTVRRQPVPKEVQDELLFQSGRRCCICFGLKQDLSVKTYGQIAHLNRNPTDNRLDNLAYMCLDHYGEYDSTANQSAPLTIGEVKRFRTLLYTEIDRIRRRGVLPIGIEAPLLDSCHIVGPGIGLPGSSLQMFSADGALYVTFYFKAGPHSGLTEPLGRDKWLHIEATMRPALSLRIQVRAWTAREVENLMRFLREGGEAGCDLHGTKPKLDELQSGDYFHVWQEENTYRMLIATLTATNVGVAAHARFNKTTASALAQYLDNAGFAANNF